MITILTQIVDGKATAYTKNSMDIIYKSSLEDHEVVAITNWVKGEYTKSLLSGRAFSADIVQARVRTMLQDAKEAHHNG